LVLIYNAAIGTREGLGLTFTQTNGLILKMYGEVGRALRLRIPVAEERAAKKRMKDSGPNLLIKGFPLVITELLAIWKIAVAVLS
jgi:hypothetical protein